MNVVALVGNLTGDPELVAVGDTQKCNFGIAYTERRKINEEWTDVPHFFDCFIWGRKGEILAEKARKGDLVAVEGALRFESWESENGKRSKVLVKANSVEGEFQYRKSGETRAPAQAELPASGAGDDDDIPF